MSRAPEALLPEGVGGGEVCQTASSAAAGAPSADVGSCHSSTQGLERLAVRCGSSRSWLDETLAQEAAETCLLGQQRAWSGCLARWVHPHRPAAPSCQLWTAGAAAAWGAGEPLRRPFEQRPAPQQQPQACSGLSPGSAHGTADAAALSQ